METTPERLAEDHWEWINGVLNTLPVIPFNQETLEYVYTTAFVHGYKHGQEAKK